MRRSHHYYQASRECQTCRHRDDAHPTYQPAPRMMTSKSRNQTCANFHGRTATRRSSQSAQRLGQPRV
jgi:hypothetical protein